VNHPLRVVLDTNVIVSALIADGPPRRILERCRSMEVILFLSDAILTELAEVMRRKFGWSAGQVAVLLQELRAFALVVTPVRVVTRIDDDPADNRVLECALEAQADVIVSGDTRHLQPLGSFDGIPILSPAEFATAERWG
jgi:uncharacterized protein